MFKIISIHCPYCTHKNEEQVEMKESHKRDLLKCRSCGKYFVRYIETSTKTKALIVQE